MQLAASDVAVNTARAGGAAITVRASVKLHHSCHCCEFSRSWRGADHNRRWCSVHLGTWCDAAHRRCRNCASCGNWNDSLHHSRGCCDHSRSWRDVHPDWCWHRERRESWCDAVHRRCSCCTYCGSPTNVLHHTCRYCDPDNASCVKVAATTVRPCVPYVFLLS